jgi:hypothetical protein
LSDFSIEPDQIRELAASMDKDANSAPIVAAPAVPETQGAEGATPETPAAPEVPDLGSVPSFDDVLALIPEKNREAALTAYNARVGEFQGTFTQKTQELAEAKKAYEGLGDLDSAREAMDFYENIQYDAAFAADVHAQLGEALGVSPEDAAAQLQEAAPAATAGQSLGQILDPDVESLRAEIDAMKEEIVEEREMQEYESQHAALSQRLASEEAQVRAAHPGWDDAKIETVYALGSADGVDIDLVASAARLEASDQAAITAWMDSKTSGKPPAVAGGAGEGHIPVEPPDSLADGHKKAIELWNAHKSANNE